MKAKRSSHHHCLWRTNRKTTRRTTVGIAATRNRASDVSAEPASDFKQKSRLRKKSKRTLELVETDCHCRGEEEGGGYGETGEP